jgi:hypothetical protein
VLATKFPTQANRELYTAYQGINRHLRQRTGNFPAVRALVRNEVGTTPQARHDVRYHLYSAADSLNTRLSTGRQYFRLHAEHLTLSILFRTKKWLTIAELTGAWATELGRTEPNPSRLEHDLVRLLMGDIINGRLDNAGPLADGRRLGLRYITREYRSAFLEGHMVPDFIRFFGSVPALLHCIVVMKEAALDFARRHGLSPPSWWANAVASSDETKNNMPPDGTAPISGAVSQKILARPGGRRPKERERVQEAMRDDIRQGRRTAAQLQVMLEKTMSSEYSTSRDTARKARKVVLSELSGTQFPTITTNDK